MISITLLVEGKERIYTVPFISGRVMRGSYPAAKVVKQLVDGEGEEDAEALDTLAAFVCDAFGGQFTLEQLYDGLSCDHLMATAISIIVAVRAGTTEALGDFPGVAEERPTPGD